MKKVVKVVSEEEYEDWLFSQESFYESQIKGTDNDPFKVEIGALGTASETIALTSAER